MDAQSIEFADGQLLVAPQPGGKPLGHPAGKFSEQEKIHLINKSNFCDG